MDAACPADDDAASAAMRCDLPRTDGGRHLFQALLPIISPDPGIREAPRPRSPRASDRAVKDPSARGQDSDRNAVGPRVRSDNPPPIQNSECAPGWSEGRRNNFGQIGDDRRAALVL